MLLVIKVGSVTNAQRGLKLLRSKGYRTTLSRMENPQPKDGCGYVLKVMSNSEDDVMSLLYNAGIIVLGVETN